MRVDNHYDDEILIAMLDSDPDALDGDLHLEVCDSCRGILDNVRLMVDALHDGCVWDRQELNDAPVPETIALLRATAAQMNAEDTQAEVYLADMLSGPRETWLPKLEHHPEWRTAGVVRTLVAKAERESAAGPQDALEMTRIATAMADGLLGHHSQFLADIRGEAWRERAYAEFFVGAFDRASMSATTATWHFEQTTASGYQLARVYATHALVLAVTDQSVEAIDRIQTATKVFEFFGDNERSRIARATEAWILTEDRDFRGALRILLDVERETAPGSVSHGETLGNIAGCYRELGETDNAIIYMERALSMPPGTYAPVTAARLRWNLALLYRTWARWSDALTAFESAKKQLLRLGMPFECILIDLDVSEVLLTIGCPNDVEKICQDAVRYFESAGLRFSRNALTALAYLKEAAEKRRATPATASLVRHYIEKLSDEPELLFLA